MDIERVLRERIKPELNFLYTERPGWRNGGSDFGWFCREHAYHSFFLCRMLRLDCDIKCGHIAIHESGGDKILSSFGEDSDHAWVRVENVCPVDLSASVEYLHPDLPKIDLVYGAGQRGRYFVTYETQGTPGTGTVCPTESYYHIRYAEQQTIEYSPAALLADPYLFLFEPQPSGLARELGKAIFDRITVHLYRVATGEIKPLYPYINPPRRAFDRIKVQNHGATEKIRSLLQIE